MATRRSTTRSSGWPRISRSGIPWSTARATSGRSTATRRPRCATPRSGWPRSATSSWPTSTRRRSTSVPTTTKPRPSRWSSPPPFPTSLSPAPRGRWGAERKVEGISDLRYESDREGMRMVIELKRGEVGAVILNQLFKHTSLQTTFGIIMIALVRNQPQVLNLHGLLSHFIEHRREVVVRRTRFDLRKAEERAHILEGLKIALDHLDAVIALIRAAASPDDAKTGLMARFGLSAIQAQAILDMRLQRLTQLEREKLVTEYQETLQKIEVLKAILASEALVRGVIRDELVEIKTKYGDERRTEIVEETAEIALEDLIAPEDVVITVSHTGDRK